MKIIGKITTMGGEENIVEFEEWVWRDERPVQITVRRIPDTYGGIPGFYEILNGKNTYNMPPGRRFSSREDLLADREEELNDALAHARESIKTIQKHLKVTRMFRETPKGLEE